MTAPLALNSLVIKEASVLDASTTAPTKGTPVIDLLSYHVIGQMMHLNWQFEEDVIAEAGDFTALATTDICTLAFHGFKTGIKVRVSNSGGALPTGLAAATDYFVIYLSANTFKLASGLVDANAGTPINLTSNGTGTNTVTPQVVAGTAGSGTYLLTVPGSYEVDPSFISVGTGTHSNIVGDCAVIDSNGTPLDYAGYVVAYSATGLAMVVNKAFVGSAALGINAADKPVKYSLVASFPVKNRNYQY